MDHRMKISEDFVSGHAQQNGEQLNNLLKSLQSFYFRPQAQNKSQEQSYLQWENVGEFVGYFLLFQLGNCGEVSKHLARLPRDLLLRKEVQFAAHVWAAVRTGNYARFFHLLRTANILQASLMHRYVTEMRLCAMRRLCKAICLPSRSVLFPLAHFQSLLMFETQEQVQIFVQQCGLKVEELNETKYIQIITPYLDSLMPRDKQGRILQPEASYMGFHIDDIKARTSPGRHCTVIEICRGIAVYASMTT
jgi:hypothetical protein